MSDKLDGKSTRDIADYAMAVKPLSYTVQFSERSIKKMVPLESLIQATSSFDPNHLENGQNTRGFEHSLKSSMGTNM